MIRKAREQLGMSQAEFARVLGEQLGRSIGQGQVSEWERGYHEPPASVMLAAVELGGGSLDRLRSGSRSTVVDRLEEQEREITALRDLVTAMLTPAGADRATDRETNEEVQARWRRLQVELADLPTMARVERHLDFVEEWRGRSRRAPADSAPPSLEARLKAIERELGRLGDLALKEAEMQEPRQRAGGQSG